MVIGPILARALDEKFPRIATLYSERDHAKCAALRLECHPWTPPDSVAESLPPVANRDLHRCENDPHRVPGVLGISLAGAPAAVAVSEVDRRNGTIRTSESEASVANSSASWISRFATHRRILVLILFVTLWCVSELSAQRVTDSTLPNAPSSSRRGEPAQSNQPQTGMRFAVLPTPSISFPELAASHKVLTPMNKFQLFMQDSTSPSAFMFSLFSAGLSQARDSYPGYGQGADGFAKRFGSKMARGASNKFFSEFVLASALHEDPRYFRLPNPTLGQSVKHALRRIVITPKDGGGESINWSGLLGPLAGEALANTYLPEDERTYPRLMKRYSLGMGTRAGTNIIREYWPQVRKKFKKKSSFADVSSDPSVRTPKQD